MRILSVSLRILTIICIGGGITLWMMARDNLKIKLGGEAEEDVITTIYSIFDEQTSSAYQVLQADPESEPKWTTKDDGDALYEDTFENGDPLVVLNDQELRKAAMGKLELRYPDPEKDQDENGVPDIKEQLPAAVRALETQDIYDDKEQLTLTEAESQVDGAVKTLQDQQYRTNVLDPVRKEFSSKGEEVISNRKNPFADTSTETYQNKLKTAFGKLYWERDQLFKEISSLRKKAVARDEHLQETQKRYIAKGIENENFEAQSQHLQLNLQDTQTELELTKKNWAEEKDALEQKVKTTEEILRSTEDAKKEADEEWRAKMEETRTDYENQLKEKERETIAAEQRGYTRGREEVLQETGQKLAGAEKPENFFAPPSTAPAVPQQPILANTNTSAIAGGLNDQNVNAIVTNVARISARDGVIILPIGSNRGMVLGGTFTLVHNGKQAARIKVTQATDTYCVANILPKFGDPHRLRPGDQIQIIQ